MADVNGAKFEDITNIRKERYENESGSKISYEIIIEYDGYRYDYYVNPEGELSKNRTKIEDYDYTTIKQKIDRNVAIIGTDNARKIALAKINALNPHQKKVQKKLYRFSENFYKTEEKTCVSYKIETRGFPHYEVFIDGYTGSITYYEEGH